MRPAIAWVILGVLASAPAAAQSWEAHRFVDDFTGETSVLVTGTGDSRKLRISVGCSSDGAPRTLIVFVDDGIFHHAGVEVRWDEGEIERPMLVDEDDHLIFKSGETTEFGIWIGADSAKRYAAEFVQKLAAHRELRMRVRRWRDELVTDRFDLSGSADAIAGLECAP